MDEGEAKELLKLLVSEGNEDVLDFAKKIEAHVYFSHCDPKHYPDSGKWLKAVKDRLVEPPYVPMVGEATGEGAVIPVERGKEMVWRRVDDHTDEQFTHYAHVEHV